MTEINEEIQMKTYEVKVFKEITTKDLVKATHYCLTEYTVAESPQRAISNIRFRIERNYGWKDGFEGKSVIKYVFEVAEAVEKKKKKKNKPQQLNLFDFDFSDDESDNKDKGK